MLLVSFLFFIFEGTPILVRNLICFVFYTAILNAQQCLLGKEAVWLRERPMFEGSNEPRIEILNCHQSLLHGMLFTT